MTRHSMALALATSLTFAGLAVAKPLPGRERIPVDVRRTTLIVRDVDRSLAFWRDALGLTVVYDRVLGTAPNTTRLVQLRGNDQFIGAIGLMRRSSDPVGLPVEYERPTTGEIILVVNATDQETRLEKVRAVPGVKITGEPTRIEYPSPDGKGVIPVMVTYIWDLDGYYVELDKIRGTPAGPKPGGQ